ncbi:hypothetical protein [Robertkochia sediminum]|uniref:hypothetical protein n=1 Tax=Robertkochia sediminum TaxID=2785326 RepID=UPI0019320B4E|nr:hypothetical protein [Robertkochia sediminum]MBL7472756.1 hypothetical protein [Robertkochia sediminum]
MKKLLLLLTFMMLATVSYGQVIVTLEDQCNCEILSGTDVTAAGQTTPAGIEVGDIYVNTGSGVLFFWDGNSWELTSGVNPAIQDFSFNATTGELTLTLEGGSTATVDISTLADTVTTLVDNGDGSFTYTSEDGTVTTFNETTSGLVDNGNGTFTYTDEDNVVTTFDAKIASIVDNGDGTFTVTDDFGTVVTVDTNNIVTTLVDNGDGSFTYTSEDGTITTFTETTSGLVDNGNGTFTYTDEDGVATTFDAKIATVLDNTDGTFTITDDFGTSVTIDTNNVVTTLVDNGNGSFTYTSEDGTITTFNETTSGLVDNGNGTFTYTDEDGVATTFDAKIATVLDNTDGTFTITDDFGTSVTIDTNNVVTILSDNGDGTFTYTSEDGTITNFDSRICVVADNGDGTYDITDDYGTTVTIDANDVLTTLSLNADNTNLDYVDENGDMNQVDLTLAVQNLETLTTLVENTDGTFTYTDEDGGTSTIDIANLETLTTLVLNADNTNLDYTNEDGITVPVDLTAAVKNLETLTTIVANADGTFTYTDEAGVDTTIDVGSLETLTQIALNPDNINIDYVDENGDTTQLNLTALVQNLETVSTLVANADGTFTYTDEDNTVTTIDVSSLETLTTLVLNSDNTNLDYTNEDGVTVPVDLTAAVKNLETLTTIVANADGTFTYTDEAGVDTTIDIGSLETLTQIALNPDNINIDYVDENGDTTQLNLTALVQNLETASTLVANADGTFTYTDEDNTVTTIDVSSLETLTSLVLNPDNTNLDYTNEDGNTIPVDLTAAVKNLETISTLIANADGTFTYTDENNTVTTIDVSSLETLTTLVLNTDNTNLDYTNEDGITVPVNLTAAVKNLETLTTLVANADGTFTYTDEAGVDTTIDVANLETLTQIALNPDNVNIDYVDENGDTTQLNLTAIVENLETNTSLSISGGELVYTNEDGDNPTVPLISSDADNNIIVGTDGALYLNVADVSVAETVTNLVDNGDGTITYTNEENTAQTISKSDITDNGNGTYTFTNGDGTDVTINTNGVVITNTFDGNLVATVTDAGGNVVEIDETVTNLVVAANGTFTYTNEAGVPVTFDAKIASFTDNLDGTYTLTDDNGVTVIIDTNNTVTNLTDNNDGLITYTNEAGDVQTVSKSDVTDNGDGTYTFTNGDGSDVTINTNGVAITNTIGGNLIATITDASGTVVEIDETVTTLLDNGDGTFTHTSEDGTVEIFDAKSATVLDNTDGTYTITDDFGTEITIDTNETVTTLGLNTSAELVYANEDGTNVNVPLISGQANNDIVAGTDGGLYLNVASVTIAETVTNLVDNGDGTFTYTNENGVGQDVSKADITANPDGTYTFTNNDGTDVTINTTTVVDNGNGTSTITAVDGTSVIVDNNGDDVDDADNDPTNELSDLALTGNQLTLTNAATGATGVDLVGYLDNTDEQTLNLNGTDLEISNGNSVDLSGFVSTDDQNLSEVLAQGNDAGGTVITNLGTPVAASDAVTKAYVDALADDDITAVNFDDTSNTLTVAEGATSFDADLSTLDQAAGVAANAANITANANAISTNATNIAANTGNITNNANAITALDTRVTDNETNISNNTTAITANAAAISANATDITANNTLITDHIAADNDLDQTNEIQDLSEVLAVGADAGSVAITGLADPTNAQDAATKNYVDNAIAGAAPTIVSGDAGNDITAGGDGGAFYDDAVLQTGISDNAADIITNATNISNNTAAINTNTTNINSNTTAISNLDGRVTLAENNISANTAAIATNAGDIADNTTLINNHITNDQDIDETNELNTGLAVNDGSIEVTDAAGTLQASLISTDANNDIDFGSDGALYLNVASVTISETITSLTDNGNGTFTYSNEAGAPVTFNANTLNITDNTDGTYSFTDETGTLIATVNTNAASNGYDNSTSGLLADNVQDAIDEVAGGSTDDQQLTLEAGNILTLEDGGTVNLTPFLDNTDNQQITAFSLDNGTNILTLTLENGGTETVDFTTVLAAAGTDDQNLSEVLAQGNDAGGVAITGLLDPTNAQDAATKAYVDAVADDDVSGVALDASNVLTITEGTTTVTEDLSSLNESVVGANDITVSELTPGVFTVDYVDGDKSDINEIQNLTQVLGEGNDAGGAVITNLGTPVAGSDAVTKDYVDALADDDISAVTFTEASNTLTVEEGTVSLNADLSSLDQAADVAVNASNITTNANAITALEGRVGTNETNIAANTAAIGTNTTNIATNTTDIADHIAADGDLSDANEIQTITSTDGSVIVTPSGINYNLSVATADGSETLIVDGQNTTVNGDGTSGNAYSIDVPDNLDNDPTNENQTVSAGAGINVNQTGQNFEVVNAAPDQVVTLADGGSGNVAIGGTYPNFTIDVASVDDADADPANEFQTISRTGDDITLSDGGGTVSIQDGDFDPTNENQTVSAGAGINVNQTAQNFEVVNAAPDQVVSITGGASGNVSVTGTYPNFTVDVASVEDGDADDSNEIQTLTQVGTDVTLSLGGGSISVADNDNDSSNEINTGFAVNGANLEITDANGTLSIPLSSISTDDQNATEVPLALATDFNGDSVDETNVEEALNAIAGASTDDQLDSEVLLETPINVDGNTETTATSPLIEETTVQEAIQQITKVTAKAGRIFYPPSVAINAATRTLDGSGGARLAPAETLDLYAQYLAEFGTPEVTSPGAPAIPTYTADQLYYYVTAYDKTVFENVTIDANGLMTYDIIATPRNYNAIINVVFMVK